MGLGFTLAEKHDYLANADLEGAKHCLNCSLPICDESDRDCAYQNAKPVRTIQIRPEPQPWHIRKRRAYMAARSAERRAKAKMKDILSNSPTGPGGDEVTNVASAVSHATLATPLASEAVPVDLFIDGHNADDRRNISPKERSKRSVKTIFGPK